MPYNWGPHYIVPTEVIKTYSGHVLLREEFDEDLLQKELDELCLGGHIIKIANPWYFRKKGTKTWIKIGESTDRAENFSVSWDTTVLGDGQYEILGMMHILIRGGNVEYIIASDNKVEISVKNPPKEVLHWRRYPPEIN